MKVFLKPIGIKSIPVCNYKTGEPLKNVCQIIQQGISKSKFNIKEIDLKLSIKVDRWNIKKYVLKNDIFYPSFIVLPENSIFFIHKNILVMEGLIKEIRLFHISFIKF
ncbi:hypothetical protein C4S77_04940 [Apibacter adventoris]|uniref:Uncharacterized protein n=1 Tax=Apibacter adventoris TaxID=1679466 RepID=A0A2S8AEH2_9FLAO|nr:hypothetical protein C4S77_04940 [Apibacter adventoris]PQL94660.1 hypothetical protein C4S76_04300 [Apibacter adventoris]